MAIPTTAEVDHASNEPTVVEIDGFRSQLIGVDHADYDIARAVWNSAIDRRPRLIARCIGTADVVAAVRFARVHDLEIAIRGRGHNVAGTAICDDGIVIDLSAMRGVRVDPADRSAWVQGGALWGDVDHETQVHGLAVRTIAVGPAMTILFGPEALETQTEFAVERTGPANEDDYIDLAPAGHDSIGEELSHVFLTSRAARGRAISLANTRARYALSASGGHVMLESRLLPFVI